MARKYINCVYLCDIVFVFCRRSKNDIVGCQWLFTPSFLICLATASRNSGINSIIDPVILSVLVSVLLLISTAWIILKDPQSKLISSEGVAWLKLEALPRQLVNQRKNELSKVSQSAINYRWGAVSWVGSWFDEFLCIKLKFHTP